MNEAIRAEPEPPTRRAKEETAAENPAAVLFLDTVLIVVGSAQGVGVFDDNMHCDKGTNAAGQ